jgi:two-component system cell cycle response regulator DivK
MLKCMVLLAEDFDDAREVYALYLEKAGFIVHDLASGDAVMPLAIELQPDVVVLDVVLPGMDGLSVARQIRAHPLTAHVPIVMLSAHAFPDDERRAREAGADVFLCKPCPPDELAAALVRVSENCREKLEKGGGRQPAVTV